MDVEDAEDLGQLLETEEIQGFVAVREDGEEGRIFSLRNPCTPLSNQLIVRALAQRGQGDKRE